MLPSSASERRVAVNVAGRHVSRSRRPRAPGCRCLCAVARRDAVAEESLENRVEMLEHQMQALIELPERVASIEAQILLLRTEMREEFSALRAEIHLGDNASRGETRSTAERIREEARATAERIREEALLPPSAFGKRPLLPPRGSGQRFVPGMRKRGALCASSMRT